MKNYGKAVLVVLDGWGYRAEKKDNAIAQALTPHYSRYLGAYANGLIQASSLPVGLPEGVMGNSEVGHMNIGAGRPILQDQVRINAAIADGSFFSLPALRDAAARALSTGGRVHLVGLVSGGNVHSSERHYVALLDFFQRAGVPGDRVLFHAITDGRDTPPQSAEGYLATLEAALRAHGGRIATLSGRFYAMDRDQRWERTELGYRAIVLGDGPLAPSATQALRTAYAAGETDEFIVPRVIAVAGTPSSRMRSGDAVVCFNFRADRMRQLVRALLYPDTPVPSRDPGLAVSVTSMTEYDAAFGVPNLFPPERWNDILGECIERAGLGQFRTAETEKYAHVTYFLNCGREAPFAHEERRMVPSPKVQTYDETPAMNSADVTAGLVAQIQRAEHSLMVVNYAQPDMVGHTGNFDAAVAAVEATDRCLGDIVAASLDHDYSVIITADHGNIEMMVDPVTGQPHTSHTLNPVPVLCIGPGMKGARVRKGGALCDLAPTLLQVMRIAQPEKMTGTTLLVP